MAWRVARGDLRTPKKMLVYPGYMNRAGLMTANTTDEKDRFFPAIRNGSRS